VYAWVYENNMSHADLYHHGVLIRVGQFDLAGDYDRDNTRTDDLSRGFQRFPLGRVDRGTLEYGSRAGLECRCATEEMIKDCVWAVPRPPQDKAYSALFNNCQQDLQRAADACCLAGFLAAPWRVPQFSFGSPFYGSGPHR